MKKIKFNLKFMSIVFIGLAPLLMSCKSTSDPTPNPQDDIKAKLIAHNWSMQSVLVDGVDHTNIYQGLSIKFTSANFSTIKGGAVWPVSGTWSFASEDGTLIKRDDGIEIRIVVSEATLQMTLTWSKSTLSGGREGSIKGQNVFNMVKQ